MVNKIIIPFLIAMILIVVQFVILPFIAIKGIVPNVVLIYLLFYSLRNGQITGMIFAFFIGFIYDLISSGLIGSGMFAFTIASFIAGYFYKEDFNEVLQNIKLVLFTFLLSGSIFFLFYSALGKEGINLGHNYDYIIYSLLSAVYTTLLALIVYLIPRKNYE